MFTTLNKDQKGLIVSLKDKVIPLILNAELSKKERIKLKVEFIEIFTKFVLSAISSEEWMMLTQTDKEAMTK